jgi:uncharacterized membrane protein SpoIIM required for sporulation
MVGMNLDAFVREREPQWTELQALVDEAGRRPERLGPDRVRRMGALYRGAAADLAAARRRFPGEIAVTRLEHLVARARHVVYDAEGRRTSIRTFFGRTYWRRVRERRAVLAVSALLLFAPLALGALWGQRDPEAAARFVPGEYRAVLEPRTGGTDLGLSTDQSASASTSIFVNNIRVTLFAFAGGITLGLLTGYVLVFNGVLIGTLAGLAFHVGNGEPFTALVWPHGVLELSCIVVGGAAGLRMGWAVVSPGHRRRVVALQQEASAAAELALGTLPWLVLAGLIEGFVTPQGLPVGAAVVVGLVFGVLYWALVLLRGAPEPSAADRR